MTLNDVKSTLFIGSIPWAYKNTRKPCGDSHSNRLLYLTKQFVTKALMLFLPCN